MRLTVIVPHLNQHESLVACLASLHDQVVRPAELKVIVVDNGSVSLPMDECAAWSDVTMVSESAPGPGPARNRGVEHASSAEVVAFVDADCTVDARWLASILSAFDDPLVDIIGGDIRLGLRDVARPEPIELYEAIYSYRNELHIAEGFSGTGNLAARRDVWLRVGPFGGKEIAEDRDWGLRSRAAGYHIAYVPEMIVYHPARHNFAELRLKWDRHVAHDFEHYRHRPFGTVRWVVRAIAVGASPIAEIGMVARSDRLEGARQRLIAFSYLCGIRSYRMWAMLRVVVTGNAHVASGAWNLDSQ